MGIIRLQTRILQLRRETYFRYFQDIFSKDELDLGLTNLAIREIDTEEDRPMKQSPRWSPMALVQEEKAENDK